MVMQTSGAISIGQARNECGLGNPVNAGNATLVKLAGLPYTTTYAWHYWYGKSNLPVINGYQNVIQSVTVDLIIQVAINLRTGAVTLQQATGNNNPRINFTNWYGTPASLTSYRYISVYAAYSAADTRVAVSIIQQPSAANDFTYVVYYDDTPNPGAVATQWGFYINATP